MVLERYVLHTSLPLCQYKCNCHRITQHLAAYFDKMKQPETAELVWAWANKFSDLDKKGKEGNELGITRSYYICCTHLLPLNDSHSPLPHLCYLIDEFGAHRYFIDSGADDVQVEKLGDGILEDKRFDRSVLFFHDH